VSRLARHNAVAISQMPLARGDPKEAQAVKRCNGRLGLVVTYADERKHLPIVELRVAA
jgi:hypothetical protein